MRGWVATFTLAIVMLMSHAASATNLADFQPIAGPTTVDLGRDLATLNVGGDYYFVDAANTKKLMQALGNPPSGAELGTIIPKGTAEWFVVIEYEDTGYVKDDQGASLDAAALLDSIRKGTEHSNAQRKLMGHPAMHVVGWVEQPHYDTLNKRLVWALSGRADGADHEVVNFNTRVLGRHGLISVVLVTDREASSAIARSFPISSVASRSSRASVTRSSSRAPTRSPSTDSPRWSPAAPVWRS
jgi:uncharacterized membrane-anchored protein